MWQCEMLPILLSDNDNSSKSEYVGYAKNANNNISKQESLDPNDGDNSLKIGQLCKEFDQK